MDKKIVIKVENLVTKLKNKIIHNNLNLYVYENEILTIFGPSGEGKSLLLKIIVGLLPFYKGKVIVLGKEINKLTKKELYKLRRKINYVFQNDTLFDEYKVWENVMFYYLEHDLLKPEEAKKLALKYLKLVNLENHINYYPKELSGGQRKRVSIARTLSLNPEVLLFDEPTSGLDPINAKNIYNLILNLKKNGKTCIVVSHNIHEALKIADRIAFLYKGKIVFTGTPSEFKSSNIPIIRSFLE
ncbi:MAG TPA: ATP-binding cassette domain-containing protein [Desulfurobacteriaceae bacterium]|nr:ATP-binding cassette domain-containing protein [Desulfurobacteriaceae bacterium]